MIAKCKNDDVLLIRPSLSYSGVGSYQYPGLGVDLVDNTTHTVVEDHGPGCGVFKEATKEFCPARDYVTGPPEMRQGATYTAEWITWILPSKNLNVPATFELKTNIIDQQGFVVIRINIDQPLCKSLPPGC